MEGARFCDKCGATQKPPPVVVQQSLPAQPTVQHTPAGQPSVSTPAMGAATRPLARATLSYGTGSIELPMEGTFTLGRGDGVSSVDFDLTDIDTDLFSSRQHAEVVVRLGEYYIKDLGSRNGTFVNGQKIGVNVEVKLQDRDAIVLGRVELVFHFGM